MTRSLTIALLAVCCAAGLAVAQADISGSWTFTTENPQGTNQRTMELEQDGDAISGTTTGDNGSMASVTGSVTGNDVKLSYDVAAVGITISMTGTVDGSTMSGAMDFGGQGTGSFTASKN